MDTSDPDIEFDAQGICNHCKTMVERVSTAVQIRSDRLQSIVEQIRAEGRGKTYDCVLGISGGVDSTYTAYLAKTLGLRPLAVHLDNGWNSELAVKNIEHVLNKLSLDLYTHVLDWEEFRDLQVAFLRASTPDAEIPTDHAISAVLFRVALQEGVRYIIAGTNLVTEGILPKAWTYGVYDWRYIKGVHARYGKMPLRTYPHFSVMDRIMNYFARRLRVVCPLNYVTYNKSDAILTLQNELWWRKYWDKHGESVYTKFFQGYILPTKFSIDKRRAHLSALIISGQITRETALEQLMSSPLTEKHERELREYVIKKLELTQESFDDIMALQRRSYKDYPNYESIVALITPAIRIGKKMGIIPPTVGL